MFRDFGEGAILMRKTEEMIVENSCWNKAKFNERLFILMSRDEAAPSTIRFWIRQRIELGLNKSGDEKLVEAERCAELMENEKK